MKQNANGDPVVYIDGNGALSYGVGTSTGVLLSDVSFHVRGGCIHFPTAHCFETKRAGRMYLDIPGDASVTLIFPLSLMILQCFCAGERLSTKMTHSSK